MGVSEKQAWTEEEDDFLRRSAEQGMSATDAAAMMAEIFGPKRSRNALLSRAMRKGISFDSQGATRAADTATARPPKPARAPTTRNPAAPKAETRLHAGNIAIKAARLKVERQSGQFERVAAEQAAIEATLAAQAADDNPGMLFLEREMSKHCAWPMPGWDNASIWEKRVCGRPVVVRRIVCDGVASFIPGSWCLSCQKLAVQGENGRRRDIYTLAGVSPSGARRAA